MELDLQSLFGLHIVHSCTHWQRPRNSPPLHIWAHIKGRYWSAKIEDISLKPPEWEVYSKPAIAERDEKQVMIVSPRNLDKVV
jgi:hypothetical protein